MKVKLVTALAALGIATTALAGCASAGTDSSSASKDSAETASPKSSEAAFTLGTSSSDLGDIIVDGDGKVVYQFDKDTQGADSSACAGECAAKWPAVPGSDDVKLDGVTGKVGTIDGVDGKPQLTLDGWPLYYFAGDTAAGETKGQGLMDVWWVLSPEAAPIH